VAGPTKAKRRLGFHPNDDKRVKGITPHPNPLPQGAREQNVVGLGFTPTVIKR